MMTLLVINIYLVFSCITNIINQNDYTFYKKNQIQIIIYNNQEKILFLNYLDVSNGSYWSQQNTDEKVFYFSLPTNYVYISCFPSEFNVTVNPNSYFTYYINIDENFNNRLYEVEFNDVTNNFTKKCVGNASKLIYYMWVTTEKISYSEYRQYVSIINKKGVLLEGNMIADNVILFTQKKENLRMK